eukprot:5552012-Alexandrium_andersonii.AAC.1
MCVCACASKLRFKPPRTGGQVNSQGIRRASERRPHCRLQRCSVSKHVAYALQHFSLERFEAHP